jgi:hypothetical protein
LVVVVAAEVVVEFVVVVVVVEVISVPVEAREAAAPHCEQCLSGQVMMNQDPLVS